MKIKVKTLGHLNELQLQKKAVVTGYGAFKIKPAAFMIHLSGQLLLNIFKKGLYVYEKNSE